MGLGEWGLTGKGHGRLYLGDVPSLLRGVNYNWENSLHFTLKIYPFLLMSENVYFTVAFEGQFN